MNQRTDTERLDWLLNNLVGNVADEALNSLLAALLMGKDGREALDMAMDGSIPAAIGLAARALAERG